MEAMASGLFALTFVILSWCCLSIKRNIWAIICGITALPLIYIAGHYWREMLAVSGKDTALLGFYRYPAAPIILILLLIFALLSMIIGIFLIAKRNNCKK